uniref:Uncharacterized protein n=1 Tax=viral metagenome TaxID=1070528 RepID=A0A6M3XNE3_9ZZZZ
MKKMLIVIIAMVFMIAGQVSAEKRIQVLALGVDSLASGANKDTTTAKTIDISNVVFEDTLMALFLIARIDTIKNDTTPANIWLDSAHIPCIIAEFRYVLDSRTAGTNDTIFIKGPNGATWASMSDSLSSKPKGGYGWTKVKVLPITTKIQVRFRDKDTIKKGPKHGKYVRWFIAARVENN